MPSSSRNTLIPGGVVVPTQVTKLTRGFNVNLGTIGANGQVVSFTVPEPTRDNQGVVTVQVNATGALIGTLALEVSIDGGLSWSIVPPLQTLALTGQPGGDTAATFAATYTIAGMGSGAIFKFGLSAYTSGSGSVWALVG